MQTETSEQAISTYAVVEAIRIQFVVAATHEDTRTMAALSDVLVKVIGPDMANAHLSIWWAGTR